MQHTVGVNHLRPAFSAMPAGYKYRRLRLSKACARIVYSVLLPLLLWLLFGSAFPKRAAAGPPGPGGGPPPLVTVAAVTIQDVNPPAEYVGHVEAVQAVELWARVQGFLEQVNFKEGSDVRAGDLLYVIEQAPYQARVDVGQALVAQAESTLTKARQYLKRAQTVRPGAVSATDLDDAVAEELRARAQLEEAKANLQIAEINLGYTTVTAPISGRIGKTRYTKGNLADSASGPLAKIVQLDPIRVIYSVSENDLAAIQLALHDAREGKKSPALTPRLKLANAEILKTTGRVEFVDNQVDPATGTIAVWALFDNPDGNLLPGQYVTVMITRSEPKMMPVVPQPAILVNQQGRYVLVVDNKNRAVARPITTGPAIGSSWAVESGLAAGEKVIVQGIQKVRPGQTVQINPGKAQGR